MAGEFFKKNNLKFFYRVTEVAGRSSRGIRVVRGSGREVKSMGEGRAPGMERGNEGLSGIRGNGNEQLQHRRAPLRWVRLPENPINSRAGIIYAGYFFFHAIPAHSIYVLSAKT